MVLGGYSNSRSASDGGPFVLYGLNQPAAAVGDGLEARMTHIFVAFPSLDLITTQFRSSPCTRQCPTRSRRVRMRSLPWT